MKKDKYSRARGGWSRILDISCEKRDHHVCFYQKDGPGPLKRMYLDRIIDTSTDSKNFTCSNCGNKFGVKAIYQKENRPAYELLRGTLKKKIVKQSIVKWF